MERYQVGDILEVASIKGRLEGVCTLLNGDRLRYLGHSQARVLTGPSRDWLVTLAVDAPVIHIQQEPCWDWFPSLVRPAWEGVAYRLGLTVSEAWQYWIRGYSAARLEAERKR